MKLPETDDYARLFLEEWPLLDVRAPVEFAEGAFPRATNIPLLENEERHQIGLCYKQHGQEAAIELGKTLLDGLPRQQRVQRWQAFVQQHPNGVLYCFRGGLRSKIVQQWIHEATGIAYPRVKGGYKALRHYLLEQLEQLAQSLQPVVIGGRTGAGKTLLLQRLPRSIDLEGLAEHRGSAFGRRITPQPSQIDFENRLAIALLKHAQTPGPVYFEDESRAIGSRHLPASLYERMCQAPLIILDAPLEARIEHSIQEYVIQALKQYQQHYGMHEGFEQWADYARQSLAKIKKRLGGLRYKRLSQRLNEAIEQYRLTQNPYVHKAWIATLLNEYYDPMYDYQIQKKKMRIIFSGTANDVEAFIKKYTSLIIKSS